MGKVKQTLYFLTSVMHLKKKKKILLHKLHYNGIRNHTLSWIGAYLSNCTYTNVVNGVLSSYVEVTSGV